MKIIVNAITVATIVIGCNVSNQESRKPALVELDRRKAAKSMAHDPACESLADFPGSLAEISSNAKTVIGGADSCVLMLMDSIAARYIANGEERYIACLVSVCNESDGYVADYMTDIMTNVFVSRADSAVHHLNALRSECLEMMLVIGMRRQIYNPSGIVVEKVTIDSIVTNLMNSPEYSDGDKKYLRRIMKQWEEDVR